MSSQPDRVRNRSYEAERGNNEYTPVLYTARHTMLSRNARCDSTPGAVEAAATGAKSQ